MPCVTDKPKAIDCPYSSSLKSCCALAICRAEATVNAVFLPSLHLPVFENMCGVQAVKDKELIAEELAAAEGALTATPRGSALMRK